MGDAVIYEQLRFDVIRRDGQPALADCSACLVHVPKPRPHEDDFRVGVKIGYLLTQSLRVAHVVVVHPGNEFSSGHRESSIERGHPPEVAGTRHSHSGIVVSCENVGCSVNRAVVYDDKLEVLERLSQHTIDR
jgi:hypothetical protein